MTQEKIASFRELMGEFFYDWNMTPNPQIHQDNDGFWVNKTSLFFDDGKCFLTYKTTTFEVEPWIFDQFKEFYNDLYLHDAEFSKVLDLMEKHWNSAQMEIKKEDGNYLFGSFTIEAKNFKYYACSEGVETLISKPTYQKVGKFFNLLNS